MLVLIIFQPSLLNIFLNIKILVKTLMYCDRLHAWWLTCYELHSSYSAVTAVNECTLVIVVAMAHPFTYKFALV